MKIDMHFDCSGCEESETVSAHVRMKFRSVSGRSWGLGSYHIEPAIGDMIEEATPEGWVAFDPYTKVTYCPKCWGEIEAHVEETADPSPPSEAA